MSLMMKSDPPVVYILTSLNLMTQLYNNVE